MIYVAHRPLLCAWMHPRGGYGVPSKDHWTQWGVFPSLTGGRNRPFGGDFLILKEANLLLHPGCICQGYSSGEEGEGSGPHAAMQLEKVLEMWTRLLARAALVVLAASQLLCGVRLRAQPSRLSEVQVPTGKKKKGKLFCHALFSHGNAGCILWTRPRCKVVMDIFPLPV